MVAVIHVLIKVVDWPLQVKCQVLQRCLSLAEWDPT